MATLMKTVKLALGTAFLVLLVFACGVGYELYNDFTLARRMQEQQVRDLQQQVEKQQRRLAQMAKMIDRLTGERQVAEIQILEQERDSAGQVAWTKLRFQEVDEKGVPLSSRPGQEVYIKGDMIHVDALVIQFQEDYVAAGDRLRGKSLCLFHRVYGEFEQVSDAALLNDLALVPEAWDDAGQVDPFIAGLWRDFWTLSNDPVACRERGVKVMHGQGVYFMALEPKVYILELENDGGLTLRPSETS